MWNMSVTVIPIVVGALRMIFKGLKRKLDELESGIKIDTLHTIALLRSTGILRRVL